jgi:hypothetical protein
MVRPRAGARTSGVLVDVDSLSLESKPDAPTTLPEAMPWPLD